MIIHDLDAAMRLGTRTLVMRDGMIAADLRHGEGDAVTSGVVADLITGRQPSAWVT